MNGKHASRLIPESQLMDNVEKCHALKAHSERENKKRRTVRAERNRYSRVFLSDSMCHVVKLVSPSPLSTSTASSLLADAIVVVVVYEHRTAFDIGHTGK